MNIEPSEADLRDIHQKLGQPQESFEENKEWLTRLWERVISDCIHRSYGEVLSHRLRAMMTPPPSIVDKRLDW